MKWITLSALALFLGFQPSIANEPNPNPNQSTHEVAKSLEFYDGNGFDEMLSEQLAQNVPEIQVKLVAVDVKAIPERLDKWLSVVARNQGIVELNPKTNRTLGGFGIQDIKLNFDHQQYGLNKKLYRPAKDYNAVVDYQPEDGGVPQIRFVAKQ